MSWKHCAAQSNGLYVEGDFEKAAYRLVTEQVIYARDRGSRTTYAILTRWLDAFSNVLGQIGLTVHHDAYHSYVVAIPRQETAIKMRRSVACFALVLRKLYDEREQAADIENGEAVVEIPEVDVVYREMLHQPPPGEWGVGELRATVEELKRYGIAGFVDSESEQPFAIIVRAAICQILGEQTLLQLAAYARVDDENEDDEPLAGESDLDSEDEPDPQTAARDHEVEHETA